VIDGVQEDVIDILLNLKQLVATTTLNVDFHCQLAFFS
jgi:DNA-directed RNA polymerase alpha subunit